LGCGLLALIASCNTFDEPGADGFAFPPDDDRGPFGPFGVAGAPAPTQAGSGFAGFGAAGFSAGGYGAAGMYEAGSGGGGWQLPDGGVPQLDDAGSDDDAGH
jgi:hypothetical protein